MMETKDVAGSPVNADFHEDSFSKQENISTTGQLARDNVLEQCSPSNVVHDGAAAYALNCIPNEQVRDRCPQDLVENSACNNIQEFIGTNGSVSLAYQTIHMENKTLAGKNGQVVSLFTNEDLGVYEEDLSMTVMKVLETRHLKRTRPLPVLVRGMEVDLLRLCIQVRDYGGYGRSTRWSSISDALGFGEECGPLLKLVYVKYLKLLEDPKLATSNATKDSISMLVSKAEENGEIVRTMDPTTAGHVGISSERKTCEEGLASGEKHVEQQQLATSESLVQMLEWLKQLALNPGDPKKVQRSRGSKWNEARMTKWQKMVLKLRAVLAIQEKNLAKDQPLESPVSHPKKRSRRKNGVGKFYAKKARRT